MSQGDVLQTMQFGSPKETEMYLQRMGARYTGRDLMNGRMVFKSAAGVYLRIVPGNMAIEVMSKCTC